MDVSLTYSTYRLGGLDSFLNELTEAESTEAVLRQQSLHLVQFAAFRPLIRSSTTRTTRKRSLPVFKSQGMVITLLLSRIFSIFKAGLNLHTPPLEVLRPTEDRPWRLLFVVLFDMAPTFQLQKLDDDTTEGEWARKVHQKKLDLPTPIHIEYVLGLEEQTIFGKRFDSSVVTSQQGE